MPMQAHHWICSPTRGQVMRGCGTKASLHQQQSPWNIREADASSAKSAIEFCKDDGKQWETGRLCQQTCQQGVSYICDSV